MTELVSFFSRSYKKLPAEMEQFCWGMMILEQALLEGVSAVGHQLKPGTRQDSIVCDWVLTLKLAPSHGAHIGLSELSKMNLQHCPGAIRVECWTKDGLILHFSGTQVRCREANALEINLRFCGRKGNLEEMRSMTEPRRAQVERLHITCGRFSESVYLTRT